jgi:hypothetical protein
MLVAHENDHFVKCTVLRTRLHPQNVPFLVEKTAYVKTQIKCTSANVPVQILYILNLPRPQLAALHHSYVYYSG